MYEYDNMYECDNMYDVFEHIIQYHTLWGYATVKMNKIITISRISSPKGGLCSKAV